MVLCVAYSTVITTQVLCPVCFTEQCLLLELCAHDCSLCGLQYSDYSSGFVPCVVYRTVLTTGALISWLFSMWLTEQCLLLELCSLCALKNSAYYWSFVLMIVLCVLYRTVLTELMVVLCVVYRTVLTTGALFSWLFSGWFTEQCLLLELCSLCALQNSVYYWSFVLMIVLCVLYRTVLTELMIVVCVVNRTVLTTGALCSWFSVCFIEQCLLLELCSHDCSLCGLQNSAYYWSFVLCSLCALQNSAYYWSFVLCVLYRTVLTTGALFSWLFSVWFTEQCLLLELCSLCALQNSIDYWSFVLMIVHCVVYRTMLTTGALVSWLFSGLQNSGYYWGFTAFVAYFINHPLYTPPGWLLVCLFLHFLPCFIVFPLSFVVCSINWILPSDCYFSIKETEKLTVSQTLDRKRTDIYVVMLSNK